MGRFEKAEQQPGGGGSTDEVTEESGHPVVLPAGVLPGTPDGFDRLWTPHRMAYLSRDAAGGPHSSTGSGATSSGAVGAAQTTDVEDDAVGCPFCAAPGQADDEGLVVARGELAFVVLNLYPYNPGHLMVCPYRHVADYTDLTGEETVEVAELTRTAMRVLRDSAGPPGFNLGMNQGHVGGAGVVGHLHQHVVPRWAGDANFLPIIARTKAVPELLGDTRARLAAAWPAAGPGVPALGGDGSDDPC